MSGGLRPGQVAEAVGVNVETLRYYERRGIIAEPSRSVGGHRLYPEATVTTLRVIKAAQNLGFTLDEVAELLEAGRHHHGARAGLQSRTEAKLAEVDQKIADLEVIRASLIAARDAGCDDLVQCAAVGLLSHPIRPDRHATGIEQRMSRQLQGSPPVRRGRRGVRGVLRCPAGHAAGGCGHSGDGRDLRLRRGSLRPGRRGGRPARGVEPATTEPCRGGASPTSSPGRSTSSSRQPRRVAATGGAKQRG